MADAELDLSVLIPARNAEMTLYATLDSVVQSIPDGISYEIIVGDHCSTDDTASEFARFEEDCYGDYAGHMPDLISLVSVPADVKTVGGVRNALAELAVGDQFLFLDSDTCLTEAWRSASQAFLGTARQLESVSSVPLLPGHGWGASWIWRNWFRYFAYGNPWNIRRPTKKGYLAGAHTLVHRDVFASVGGYDDSLATGEDVNLTHRIRAKNYRVRIEPGMAAIHHGYPQTVKEFFKREVWHGIGDYSSWDAYWNSQVAIVSTIFAAQVLFLVLSVFVSAPAFVFALVAVAATPMLVSAVKFKNLSTMDRVRNWAACNLYLAGRATSLLYRGRVGRLS